MKVSANLSTNFNSPAFTAGRIEFYLDFDGTYFPFRHSKLHNISENETEYLNKYFQNLNSFFNSKKNNFSFKITTGRSFGAFKAVTELIKSKGIKMPLPDSLIAKNGSDEYIKIGTDENYYKTDLFPFNYDKTNLQKENNINKLTAWDGKAFRQKIVETLKKYNFKIIEYDSGHSVKDYGKGSLFAHVGYDNFNLDSLNMPPRSEWAVGLRNDGNLKFYLSFPYDMLNVEERRNAYNDIKSKLLTYMDGRKVNYVIAEKREKSSNNRPVIIFEPKIEGKALSKLYDTKEAVKRARLNNDFVIAAGNGSNDIEMLNPLNYIDTKGFSSDLKNADKLLEKPEIVKQLKDLPFVGIVVKNDKNKLAKLFKLFGKFGKIIEVERGKLQDGIETALKMFEQKRSGKTNNRSFKAIALIFSAVSAGGAVFLHNKKQKSKAA